MPKVLISDKMSPLAESILRKKGLDVEVKTGLKPDELAAIVGDYEGLVVRSATKVTSEILDHASKLKFIARAGTGTDNIDKKRAGELGILVSNTPGQNTTTTAEHAIALMMALMRNIPQGTATLKNGEWAKSRLLGREICGKTLGVLGLGRVGRIVADRALGLRMKVIGYDPVLSAAEIYGNGVEPADWDTLLSQADILTIHVPLGEKTRGLIDKAAFHKMKQGAFLIHAARGGIVDEDALLEALNDGTIAGAALDVFVTEPPEAEHPLVNHPNVICTPHLGASTKEAQDNCAVAAAEQVAAYLLEARAMNIVNKDLLK